MAKEEQAKKPYSKEKIGVTVMLVGLTAAIFLAIGYWAGTQSESLQCDDPVEITGETPPVPDLPEKISTTSTTSATTTSSPASNITYTNSKYNFSLTMNKNWENYKVIDWKDVNTEGPAPAEDVYSFYLPSTDSDWPSLDDGYAKVFVIDVYPNEVYDSLSQEDLNPSKIARNGNYTFTASTWQDAPSDLIEKDLGVNEILDSITFE